MADKSFKAVFAYMGYAQEQNDITCNFVGLKRKQSGSSNSYQRTGKATCVDKDSGTYARSTTKEVVSTGDTFKERPTGRVGVKNDYTTTKTCRVGDESGYSEYQVQERFRRVDYGGNSSHKGSSGSIKGSSSSSRKKNVKGSSSAKGGSSTKGIKASASIKTSRSTKGGKVRSSTKASAIIKSSYSTQGSYYW